MDHIKNKHILKLRDYRNSPPLKFMHFSVQEHQAAFRNDFSCFDCEEKSYTNISNKEQDWNQQYNEDAQDDQQQLIVNMFNIYYFRNI